MASEENQSGNAEVGAAISAARTFIAEAQALKGFQGNPRDLQAEIENYIKDIERMDQDIYDLETQLDECLERDCIEDNPDSEKNMEDPPTLGGYFDQM